MRRQASKTAILVAIILAVGCTTRPLVKTDPNTESYVIQEFQQAGFLGVDILVVVDNSKSMGEEQENLAEEFPGLIQALLNPPEGADYPAVDNLHVGVISTDMGTGGYTVETCSDPIDGDDAILQHDPNPLIAGCDGAYPTYLSYDSPDPDLPLIEGMAQDFGCIATLGTSGCGFEQQLEAAVKGLTFHTQEGGANAGFLRPESLLMVLFVTDEEDCSVQNPQIFDQALPLGHPNLRCFLHPDMVHPVDRYVDAFRTMRDPERLVLGFIIGVPPGSACEGSGDDIGDCLEIELMQEVIDPENPTRLRPSCIVPDVGEAYPPRRLVDVAHRIGEASFIHSICTDDFGPAIDGLTEKLTTAWDRIQPNRELEIEKTELDPCLCEATCSFIEELVDLRSCPDDQACYEPAGPGTGCGVSEDEFGYQHTLCTIPQAPTRLNDCSRSCTDPDGGLTPEGEGWYYLPYSESGSPEIVFPDQYILDDGSKLYIQCESMICPESRQCGPVDFPKSVCCDEASYCDRDALGAPVCVPRPE